MNGMNLKGWLTFFNSSLFVISDFHLVISMIFLKKKPNQQSQPEEQISLDKHVLHEWYEPQGLAHLL